MQICFFSDDDANNFLPLTLTRPVDDLRVGLFTINEKWKHALSVNTTSRIVPDYLADIFPKKNLSNTEDCIWVNSRFLPSPSLLKSIQNLSQNEFLTQDEQIVAARTDGLKSQKFQQENNLQVKGFKEILITNAKSIDKLWDLLSFNSSELASDIAHAKLKPLTEFSGRYDVTVQHEQNIFISDDVVIEPGCILIAQDGPIVLMQGATIEAGSIIKGPVAVCENATVKMASRIYNGTTIGPHCKIGGEVSNCIFHSYSNKAHDGFTGNSLFGQWVNLGADTVTSNLKNNYSNIRIENWSSKKPVDTELQFFGTVMGDHSKTAINTTLNTGTLCGVSSNIFTNKFSPKYIPSFTWLGSDEPQIYKFDKALEVMQAMMKRRDKEVTAGYQKMMKFIFDKR